MRFLSVREEDHKVCRRACLIAVWVQFLFTAVMTIRVLEGWTYCVFAALSASILLLSLLAWDKKPVRITVRILSGVIWLLFFLLILAFVLSAIDGWHYINQTKSVAYGCNLVIPTVGWLTPGLATVALKRGRYDRIVSCFGQIVLTVFGAIAAFFPAVRDVYQWTFPTDVVLTVWFIVTVVSTVITVACALLRPQKEIEIEGSSLGLETLETEE